jgi:hypothetical protein
LHVCSPGTSPTFPIFVFSNLIGTDIQVGDYCWFPYFPKDLTVITQIYELTEHPVLAIDVFVRLGLEMVSTVSPNISVYDCNLCHMRVFFVVCFMTHCVANIIVCKILCWFIKFT